MRYIYFTKLLQSLKIPELIAFLKEVGLDGADMAVRPGFPVTPENVGTELPAVVKTFKDEGLVIGLVTAPTNASDPEAAGMRATFEACGKAGIPAIKIGYFPYKEKFDTTLGDARKTLAGFAKLAEKTGVKACYHTHSGNNLGNNCAGLRLLLQDLDPHYIGAIFDTGHTAINGGPPRMEMDLIRSWLSLVSIKDMLWEKQKDVWQAHVVPAGTGIIRWTEVAQGLRETNFNGTISLHGEYETKDLAERKKLAKEELAFLKERFKS